MSRAYVVPKQPDVPYPLEDLVNTLVFNDEESVRRLITLFIKLSNFKQQNNQYEKK